MLGELCMYSIFDSKLEGYLQPIFAENDAVAVRILKNAVDDPDHLFSKNAEDYALFRIGIFVQETGVIVPELGVLVVKAHELKGVNGGLSQ